MAPSRRKGASKAAAAAAARRQWKVGDLVLAKVKGFPAWPATVSEPERWGYSNDWKKVVVYFFGTQQIAFCNPADVEAFNEEKKQCLLKRQGKGADFVRAVQEIVDSYEKLKKEFRIGENNSGGEVTGADVSSTVDLSANIGVKDETETPDLMLNSEMKSSVSAAEDASAAALREESSNKEASLEEPTDNSVAVVKSPFSVTYSSQKKSADLSPQGYIAQRVVPVRRSRSLSRVQNVVMPSSDGGKSTYDISATAVQNVSVRRNKHIRKSPSLSGCDDGDSSGLASNGSLEDNGSEIFLIDSDTYSLNEGSAIDSSSKLEQSETIECLAGEVELMNGLDLEMKAMVNKKKRKPNRKRVTNDAAKLTITPDEEAFVGNTSQSLQNTCDHLKERCSEHDGDKHLPLLKRARVRMGKSSSVETELNSTLQAQEKRPKEDIGNSLQQNITSSKSENGSPADGDSSLFNGDLDSVSPSKNLAPCSESGLKNCKIKKDQSFGCSIDGEAVLPPSKRLHRALEAMSANAAEGQGQTEASSATMASNSTCCMSSITRCPCMPISSPGENGLVLLGVDSCGNDSSDINVSSFSTSLNPMISKENNSSIEVDKQLIMFQNREICQDALPGASDQVSGDQSDSVICRTAGADSQIQLRAISPPNFGIKCGEVGSSQDSPGSSLSPNGEDSVRIVDHSNKASDTSELIGMSLEIVSSDNQTGKFSSQDSSDVPLNMVTVCEDTECMKPVVGDSSKANDICKVVKEVKCKGPEQDINSASFSDDSLGEKGILGLRSSPSLTDGGDFHLQGSPPNMSVCNVSTSDSSNVIQNNGSCSPDVQLHQKQSLSVPVFHEQKDGLVASQKPRSMGKSTEAGHAALIYFEAMLGSLTRTKESIGRATRIAIDCAKFGNAAKVVETLVHSLETESSLHRRVDLFFLVDSIAQCSRGLKGGVGGVYPSAIQAVLPCLLSAAVPPGCTAQENRRQCLKVLRLWLDRKILPEPIIHHHIWELDSYSGSSLRRTLRTERAFHDPIREMEGMLVDEYGSNSSFQLPGFCMPPMLKDEDEGSDSDGGNFEAVTPEHDSETHDVNAVIPAIEKHRHVLEDVDGELEMEDVAPSCDVEMNSFYNVDGGNASQASHNQVEKSIPLFLCPPLPQDVPISSPPLPSSPPPPPPPPPPPSLHLMSTGSDSNGTAIDSKLFTNTQMLQDNSLHSMAALRNSQPISEAVHYRVPEGRDMQMHMPESTCSFSSVPMPPPDSFRHSARTMHSMGYPLRPPHHVPSDQFSFVQGELQVKPRREVPPPLYSSRHHIVQNMERENLYNNHERLKPPPFEYQERWRCPAPYTGHRYQDKAVPAPYGCHPRESIRLPGHGWRFPPRSMNHRNSLSPFDDAISVTSRGPSFWRQPR